MPKKLLNPKDRITVYIDRRLNQKIQLLTVDPLSGKPKYSTLSKIVESLLQQWLNQKIQAQAKTSQTEAPQAPEMPIDSILS